MREPKLHTAGEGCLTTSMNVILKVPSQVGGDAGEMPYNQQEIMLPL